MKTYHVTLRETCHLDFDIEAENRDEVMQKAERLYVGGDVLMHRGEANLYLLFDDELEYRQLY